MPQSERPVLSTPRLMQVLVALAVGAAIWSSIGPANLGGSVTVAVTRGISMEPMFSQGDMVFVRQAAQVRPGDVILYRSADTGHRILHRVLSTDGSRFITKGDNNDWLDTDDPTMAEIDGIYWFHIAGAGGLAARLQSPMASAAFGGVLLALFAMSLAPGERVLKPLTIRNSRKWRSDWSTRTAVFAQSSTADTLMAVLATLAAASMILAAWVFAQPTSAVETLRTGYAHAANWSYEALPVPGAASASPADALLAADGTKTGQPIFPAVTPLVEFRLNYRLSAPNVSDVSGRGRIVVILREDSTGWSNRFDLVPWTDFEGPELSLAAPIDLREAMALFAAFEAATETRGALYRAILAFEVDLDGAADTGEPFSGEYRSLIVLRVEPPSVVRPEASTGTATAEVLAAGIDPLGSVFNQIASRDTAILAEFPRVVSLFVWDIPIWAVRIVAVALILLSLVGAAILAWLRARSQNWGAWFMIRARYGDRLAFAAAPPKDAYDRPYIEVMDFDDVRALADARGQPLICVETQDSVEIFVLDLPNGVYRMHLQKGKRQEGADARAEA